MFFRRKPKAIREQEEPLVPHGLIWQATAQEDRQSAPAPPTPISASPNRPIRQMENKANRPSSTRKLGAISPPIPWPSPLVQGIVRRPHSPIETERVAAIAMGQLASIQYREKPQISPALVPKPETALPRVLETPRVQSLPSPVQKPRPQFRDRFLGLGKRYHALGESWAKARLELAANLRALKAEVRLAERTRHAGEFLKQQVQKGMLWPRRLKPPLTSLVTLSRTAPEKLISIARPAFRRIDNWSERSARAAGKVLDYKIRVGLHSERWSRLSTRIKAVAIGWTAKPFHLKFDSRLWTSMAMAAISAGMILAFISVLRHYEPEGASPPTRRSLAPPSARAKSVKTRGVTSRTNLSPRPVIEKPSAARPATPAARTQSPVRVPVLPAEKIHRRKPRAQNGEDSDYVARDTYVYYGPNGKSEH